MPWAEVRTKVPPDMKARIEKYTKTSGATDSEALRHIISAGLNVLISPTPDRKASQDHL